MKILKEVFKLKIRLNKVLVLVLVLAMMATTVYALPNFDRGNGPENAPPKFCSNLINN
jgi:hypothetical protein